MFKGTVTAEAMLKQPLIGASAEIAVAENSEILIQELISAAILSRVD